MIDSLRVLGAGTLVLAAMAVVQPSAAQTRERGPWWPSVHGPEDQAGASNYVTAAKILAALTIPKTGQTYELGHPYEASMPQYGSRPYFLNVLTRAATHAPGDPIVHTEYFTGYIGQMGTQFDALSHQGRHVRMTDGSVEAVFYNGFTDTELMGPTHGLGGVAALGVEQMKPFITRGVLIDIAGFKQVPALPPAYEVTMADVRGALARQHMSETSIAQGDAVLFNYGWAVNWTNPQSTTIRSSAQARIKAHPASASKWPIGSSSGTSGSSAATRAAWRFADPCRRRASTTCSS